MRFTKLKNDILGKKYSLSIAFVSENKSKEINNKYRKYDKAANVLSFSLREDEGELVLCKPVIKNEAKNSGRKYPELLRDMVIHGMLHLKGMTHSSTIEREEMERAEIFYAEKYEQKYFYRNRRGLLRDASPGGRIFKR